MIPLVWSGIISAWLIAQGFQTAIESAPAKPDQGLRLSIDLQSSGAGRQGRFERLADAILDLRMQAIEQPVMVLLDSDANRWMALPLLFTLELMHDDGFSVVLPEFTLGTDFHPERDWGSLTNCGQIQKVGLSPAKCLVPLAKLGGIGGYDLKPGIYRLRACYRGVPEEVRQELGKLKSVPTLTRATWRGSSFSQELRFEITGIPEPLNWSEPNNGLRIAGVVRPRGMRFFWDETPEPYFLVENVGEQPIKFVRVLGGTQEDEKSLSRVDGKPVQGFRSRSSGWSPTVTWTLMPGQRVWLDVYPFKAPYLEPGRYRVEYSLRIGDKRFLSEDETNRFAAGAEIWKGTLTALPFEWEFLARDGQ